MVLQQPRTGELTDRVREKHPNERQNIEVADVVHKEVPNKPHETHQSRLEDKQKIESRGDDVRETIMHD